MCVRHPPACGQPPRPNPNPNPHAGFASDQCPEGFVAVAKGSLRILAVENVGETFNQQVWAPPIQARPFCVWERGGRA